MSTRTIAVELRVYQKLSRIKGEGESFSRVIERLVDRHLVTNTGLDVIAALADAPSPLTDSEADAMLGVVDGARRSGVWRRLRVG